MTQIASSKSKRFIQQAEYFRLHHKPILGCTTKKTMNRKKH